MASITIRNSGIKLPGELSTEIVERKGLGHPDTVCDIVAERVSNDLCRYYLDKFGFILHHNVDKALLIGGESRPAYKGGKILHPMEFIIAGRAVMSDGDRSLPISEIAEESIKKSFSNIFSHFTPDSELKTRVRIMPGSIDLVELFRRQKETDIPLSNDTSFGTGYYPFDAIEKIVLKTEKFLNSSGTKTDYPYIGEDVKVMGVRQNERVKLIVAIAIVDRYIEDIHDYTSKVTKVKKLIKNMEWIDDNTEIFINTADSYESESIYLTVTGTSAESGDDGEVGRGNRSNGLITPGRSMTIEAVAGKNPVNHVGKIYNIFAGELSREIVVSGYASDAVVNIVSQIGKPVTEPMIFEILVRDQQVKDSIILDLSEERLGQITKIWEGMITGKYKIV